MSGKGSGRRRGLWGLVATAAVAVAAAAGRRVDASGSEEVREALQAMDRVRAGQLGVRTGEPVLEASILVGARRYDAWRMVEVSEVPGVPAIEKVPLVVFVLRVRAKGLDYITSYLGPPFPVPGLERLAPARAAEQLAVVDSFAFDGREVELLPYRRGAAARSGDALPQYELALMIWFAHFSGVPGSVLEAERPLRHALQLRPRSPALHGLLGEVLLRGGRDAEAARSFAEAARLRPRHPRYHYCASVAFEKAGETSAGQRALDAAKAVAGPRLKRRFTPGSNPLEDYRSSLLEEALNLRQKRESGTGSSASGFGAPPRKARARRARGAGLR